MQSFSFILVPGAGGNAWYWHLLAHERRREAAERLRDEGHALRIPIADRVDDRGGVLWKSGPGIRRRKFDRDSLVTELLQLRREQVPVPGVSARAGNEDEAEALHGFSARLARRRRTGSRRRARS